MKLYGYWRSSAAYRVRIALNLKGIAYQNIPVDLVKDGGQHRTQDYRSRNPQMLVPLLENGDFSLSQSLAIMEYLEECYRTPPLLPENTGLRALVRQFSLAIACDIHPLLNSRVLKYLKSDLEAGAEQSQSWYENWIHLTFPALESWIQAHRHNGSFCFGETPGMADICLVPQIYNARRFNVCLEQYPNLLAVDSACAQLDAFAAAKPENQPDAPA